SRLCPPWAPPRAPRGRTILLSLARERLAETAGRSRKPVYPFGVPWVRIPPPPLTFLSIEPPELRGSGAPQIRIRRWLGPIWPATLWACRLEKRLKLRLESRSLGRVIPRPVRLTRIGIVEPSRD